MIKIYHRAVETERWDYHRLKNVKIWLEENFGEIGDRWDEERDYDLTAILMDEDIYIMYILRWS